MKKERGITLIALVITIIVLLILAGVSISLVIGNNGVLNQATNAVVSNRKSSAKEDVEMAWAGATTKYWNDWTSDTTKVKNLEFYKEELEGKNTSGGIITTILEGEDEGTYEVNYTSNDQNQEYKFIIDSDGNANTVGIGNAAEIANDASNIGKKVNYGVTYNTGLSSETTDNQWRILYANQKNIYLITNGCMKQYINNSWSGYRADIDSYNGTQDFEDLTRFPAIKDGWLDKIYKNKSWSSTNQSVRSAEWLLDSTVETWSALKNDYAKYVIGSPSLELLYASYKAVNPSTTFAIGELDQYGYPMTLNTSNCLRNSSRPWMPQPESSYPSYGFYVAGPRAAYPNCDIYGNMSANNGRNLGGNTVNANYWYLRPVICLKSNVVLTWNSATNQYDLSLAE